VGAAAPECGGGLCGRRAGRAVGRRGRCLVAVGREGQDGAGAGAVATGREERVGAAATGTEDGASGRGPYPFPAQGRAQPAGAAQGLIERGDGRSQRGGTRGGHGRSRPCDHLGDIRVGGHLQRHRDGGGWPRPGNSMRGQTNWRGGWPRPTPALPWPSATCTSPTSGWARCRCVRGTP
jgi:hypothetical protein